MDTLPASDPSACGWRYKVCVCVVCVWLHNVWFILQELMLRIHSLNYRDVQEFPPCQEEERSEFYRTCLPQSPQNSWRSQQGFTPSDKARLWSFWSSLLCRKMERLGPMISTGEAANFMHPYTGRPLEKNGNLERKGAFLKATKKWASRRARTPPAAQFCLRLRPLPHSTRGSGEAYFGVWTQPPSTWDECCSFTKFLPWQSVPKLLSLASWKQPVLVGPRKPWASSGKLMESVHSNQQYMQDWTGRTHGVAKASPALHSNSWTTKQ